MFSKYWSSPPETVSHFIFRAWKIYLGNCSLVFSVNYFVDNVNELIFLFLFCLCLGVFFPFFFLKMSSLNLSCCCRLSQGNLHGCCAILMQRCPLVFESVDPKMSVHPPFRFKSFWSTMAPKPIRGTPRKKDLESTITTRRECQLIVHETIRTHPVCVRTQKSNTHNCQVFYKYLK